MAAQREKHADEFIVYREAVVNISRFIVLGLLATMFYLFPETPIRATFAVAAVFALGMMLLQNGLKIKV